MIARIIATVYFYDVNTGWIQAIGWKEGSYAYRLLKTTDRGVFWDMRTHPWLSADAYIQFLDSTYGYRTGSNIPFFRTTDGGETWDLVTWYGYMVTFNMQFLTKEIGWISVDGPVLTTLTINTSDGGENWSDNFIFQCSDLSTYLCFVDTLNGWVVQWTCLNGGRAEIWNTSDGGSSWELQFTFSPPFYFKPKQIFFVDSLHGWVIGENGIILHTSNGGVIPVELISFNARVIEDMVILEWTTATETNNQGFEIYKKSEVKSQGSEWEKIGFVPGFGTTTEPRSYSFIDENITTGIYYFRLKQIDYNGTFSYSDIVKIEFNQLPTKFNVYQNYPNPFNPVTTIKYDIVKAQSVKVTIYDIIGREVATLVNEQQQPGSYEIKWDASNVSSGIYFYQLKTKDYVYTKKMILMK